jgi:hypothetical protein
VIKPVLATIFAALAVTAAGCGESSGGRDQSGPSDVASTITREAFIKQADAICAKATKRIGIELAAYLEKENIKEIGQAEESPIETKARQVEVIETLGIPALRRQHKEIEALGLPHGDEARAEAYLDAGEKGIEEGEANPTRLYNSARKIFAKSDKLAQELGLKVCGNR